MEKVEYLVSSSISKPNKESNTRLLTIPSDLVELWKIEDVKKVKLMKHENEDKVTIEPIRGEKKWED